jgi:hypothetical protein
VLGHATHAQQVTKAAKGMAKTSEEASKVAIENYRVATQRAKAAEQRAVAAEATAFAGYSGVAVPDIFWICRAGIARKRPSIDKMPSQIDALCRWFGAFWTSVEYRSTYEARQ